MLILKNITPTFALLFPGQGSQYIGMCAELIQQFAVAEEVFEEANQVLNFDLRSLILNGNINELTLSENAQPAVVTASYALFRVFEELIDGKPVCAAGHSLGEISALIAAGALSFSDGLLYARKRGELMHHAVQEKKGGAGIVVDLDVKTLNTLIDSIKPYDYVTISGYNSPRQFIVAGTSSALLLLEKEVDKNGGEFIPFKMMPMKVDSPYHSNLMAFLTPQFRKILPSIKFKKTNFDIWSTITAKVITLSDSISDILCNQLILPVCWNQVLKGMCKAGVELLIDIGPQEIMSNLVKENPGLPISLAFDSKNDKEKIIRNLSKRLRIGNGTR